MKYVVATAEEIPPGGRKILDVAGRSIGVFNADGEWSQSRVLYGQFQNLKNNDLDQFRQAGTQVVLTPPQYRSGKHIYPYNDAKK